LGGLVATATVTFQDGAIGGLNQISNSPVLLGVPIRFTATINAGTNVSYSWDFGDGSADSAFSITNWVTHTYAAPAGATYSAVVTARNTAGQQQDSLDVTVDNPDPGITSISHPSIPRGVNHVMQITGTLFVPGAIVQIQRGAVITDYVATYISPSRLSVTIVGADIGPAGAYSLFVVNPAPPVALTPRRSVAFPFTVT
jgi:PKD repeat protein